MVVDRALMERQDRKMGGGRAVALCAVGCVWQDGAGGDGFENFHVPARMEAGLDFSRAIGRSIVSVGADLMGGRAVGFVDPNFVMGY
jgi:hypothetical protein